MRRRLLLLAVALLCGLVSPVKAQGVIPIALQQVISANGQPLSGALLYVYQAGTVATPQNAFSDPGLTIPLSNPLVADSTGRLPMFYLANGSVHVRLTDSGGVVIFDYPTMLEPILGRAIGLTLTRSVGLRLVKRIEPKLRQARIDGMSQEEYKDVMTLVESRYPRAIWQIAEARKPVNGIEFGRVF
jgi:hypothetical protein